MRHVSTDINSYRRDVTDIDAENKTIDFHYVENNTTGAYLEVPFTLYSDYINGTVERSNADVFKKQYGEVAGVYEGEGTHGGRCIIIEFALYENNTNGIQDLIEELFRYPCIDDENLSELEDKLFEEDWEDWIKRDLIKELEKLDLAYPEDSEELKTKFKQVCNDSDIEIICEDAIRAWVDVEKVAKAWE